MKIIFFCLMFSFFLVTKVLASKTNVFISSLLDEIKVSFNESMAPLSRLSNKHPYNQDWVKTHPLWKKASELYEKNIWQNLKIEANPKIPKIIHQIWLGGNLPQKYFGFIESWKKFHPEWEYKLWTDNDIDKLGLVNRKIYDETDNFAQKSDIARYEILYRLGGLYVDTDFECLKPFDIWNYSLDFYVGIEFSSRFKLNNALIAATKNHPILLDCINQIDESFYNVKNSDQLSTPDDYVELIIKQTGPLFLTNIIKNHWDNPELKIGIFPNTFFYPFNAVEQRQGDIAKYIKTETFAVHHWSMSWVPEHIAKNSKIYKKIKKGKLDEKNR